jgi:hypothetical protein
MNEIVSRRILNFKWKDSILKKCIQCLRRKNHTNADIPDYLYNKALVKLNKEFDAINLLKRLN